MRGWYGGAPHLVAVVGSDARPGRDPTQALADSLHIIGLDGKGGAGLVGIPRDSWVTIPDRGRSKINAALATGGPDRMMATLEDLSGLDLDGYVLTGFEGFTAMVGDVLGGFEMDVPQAFTDRSAKASFTAGPQHIDGSEALAFARSRKAWIDGDFRRQLHGGLVMIAALAQTKSRGPTAIPRLMAGMEPWLVTDLPPARLLTLALAANAVDPMRITNVVLRGGTSTTSGGASIVVLDEARAAEVFSDLADGSLEG